MPPGVTTGRMTAWTEEVRNQTFSHIHRKSLTRRLVPVSNPDEVARGWRSHVAAHRNV
jgi:hypothetical protein